MVTPTQTYTCEVCGKTSKDLAKAEACEKKCKAEKKHADTLESRKTAIVDKLTEIRKTSVSLDEIANRVTEYGKELFDDTFMIDFGFVNYHGVEEVYKHHREASAILPDRCECIEGRVDIIYSFSKKVVDIFGRWNNTKSTELDYSEFLRHVGIHTGGGSGNGRLYSLTFRAYLPLFPAMSANIGTIRNVVAETNAKIGDSFITHQMRFNNQPEVVALIHECGFIEAEISRLKAQVTALSDKLDEISTPFNLELKKEYQDITKEASDLMTGFKWSGHPPQELVHELTRLKKLAYFKENK